jgi:DNA-binding transcriptional MerR regulator
VTIREVLTARGLGDMLTVSEAAEETGVSVSTLKRWYYRGIGPSPSQTAKFGQLTVHLYTRADIKAIKKFKGTLRRGPVPGSKKK